MYATSFRTGTILETFEVVEMGGEGDPSAEPGGASKRRKKVAFLEGKIA